MVKCPIISCLLYHLTHRCKNLLQHYYKQFWLVKTFENPVFTFFSITYSTSHVTLNYCVSKSLGMGHLTEYIFNFIFGFLAAQLLKNLPAMQETWVGSLGWEDPLEKGKATHSSILAWKIPWTVLSQRVGHDWATFTFIFIFSQYWLILIFLKLGGYYYSFNSNILKICSRNSSFFACSLYFVSSLICLLKNLWSIPLFLRYFLNI